METRNGVAFSVFLGGIFFHVFDKKVLLMNSYGVKIVHDNGTLIYINTNQLNQ